MLEVFRRTRCQRLRMTRFRRNRISIRSGMMHMLTSVSCQLTASMMIRRMTSVRQSTSTFTMPLVNRSLSEFTSLITRTRIFPAERVSKKENDSP